MDLDLRLCPRVFHRVGWQGFQVVGCLTWCGELGKSHKVNSFREAFDYNESDDIILGRRQASDEVKVDVGPGILGQVQCPANQKVSDEDFPQAHTVQAET